MNFYFELVPKTYKFQEIVFEKAKQFFLKLKTKLYKKISEVFYNLSLKIREKYAETSLKLNGDIS